MSEPFYRSQAKLDKIAIIIAIATIIIFVFSCGLDQYVYQINPTPTSTVTSTPTATKTPRPPTLTPTPTITLTPTQSPTVLETFDATPEFILMQEIMSTLTELGFVCTEPEQTEAELITSTCELSSINASNEVTFTFTSPNTIHSISATLSLFEEPASDYVFEQLDLIASLPFIGREQEVVPEEIRNWLFETIDRLEEDTQSFEMSFENVPHRISGTSSEITLEIRALQEE